MRGGLLCKASGLENLFKPNAMKLASMAEVQPSLCNYPNPGAHWPKVSEGLGTGTHINMGPERGH